MTLIEKLKADAQEHKLERELTVYEVNGLGYLLSKRAVLIGEPVKFELIELLHEGSNKPSGLSYLLHIESETGYIMPVAYEVYLSYTKNL